MIDADGLNALAASEERLARPGGPRVLTPHPGEFARLSQTEGDRLTRDVLTGIITAWVCQGLAPRDAAVLGAHVHGLAGDLAAAELGQVSLIASDLLRYLPKAFLAVA